MLIQLTKSKLFTVAPENRFAIEYRVHPDMWRELWKRHSYHDYSLSDLCDYFELKTKREISAQAMQRWLWRSYVYMKAHGAMKLGVEVVTSEFFGNFEQDVVKEVTKNLKSSVKQDTKVLI